MAASMLGLRQAHRADVNTERRTVMTDTIELLAAYFTIAGDIYPLGPTEISPFPFRDRVRRPPAPAIKAWASITPTRCTQRARSVCPR